MKTYIVKIRIEKRLFIFAFLRMKPIFFVRDIPHRKTPSLIPYRTET